MPSSSFKLIWRGKELSQRWRDAADAATFVAAEEAVALCQAAVSTPYPPPSTPGTPPHLRTGTGRESIVPVFEGGLPTARSGVMILPEGRHMLLLEVGTSKIAPRPWLKSTILRNKAALRELARRTFRHYFP